MTEVGRRHAASQYFLVRRNIRLADAAVGG
jgi:hypothetical protein